MNKNVEAVAVVLARYQDALNASDTDAVMPLYAEDGVFMPPYSPSAVGATAVRRAYDAVFEAIKLTVTFKVAEIVEMGPDWAFARTNSAGTVEVHARVRSTIARRVTIATSGPPLVALRFKPKRVHTGRGTRESSDT